MKNSKDITYNYNTYHAAKVIISAFLTAYLHNVDIKTSVYDRFKEKLEERLEERPTPEDKERFQILSKCLHYFTNPSNKEKLDLLRQPYEEGREQFYNGLITEIVVLPEFAHAYANGLNVNDVYRKFEEDIPSETSPQTIEKRQLLANCLNLFENNQYKEELSTLSKKIDKSDPEISDMKFAGTISSTFPEVIFGTSQTKYVEIILPHFTTAYTNGDDIKAVFDKFRNRLPNDNTTLTKEKRAVLENTLDHFKKAKYQTIIDSDTIPFETTDNNGQPLPAEEISKKILENSAEELLGDKKRKYDMSELYSPTAISSLKFIPTKDSKKGEKIYNDNGNMLIISQLGELVYSENGFVDDWAKIGQYSITFISADNTETRSAEVFTKTDFDRLDRDDDYYQAFVNELFSKNNINLSNTCNYIGEITSTTRHDQKVGNESVINGIYQYQISENYALMYDYVDLSAVVDYTRQQEKDNQTQTDSSER